VSPAPRGLSSNSFLANIAMFPTDVTRVKTISPVASGREEEYVLGLPLSKSISDIASFRAGIW
jgi:hypothetical protein